MMRKVAYEPLPTKFKIFGGVWLANALVLLGSFGLYEHYTVLHVPTILYDIFIFSAMTFVFVTFAFLVVGS